MKPILTSALAETKSLVIMLPKGPYFDQVAAALSLFLTLKDKNTTIICDTPMTVEYNRLVGVNKIASKVGNKNLVIRLTDYPAENVERVNYDVDANELFLTVFPLPGTQPPTEENIKISYAGVAADTVLLIGGGNETHFPLLAEKDFLEMKVIHIGINDINLGARQVMSLAKGGASISEVVAGYLFEAGIEVNADVATNLFMGLTEGTRNFTNSTVTAETFKIASELLAKGARREQLKAYQPPKSTTLPPQQDPSIPKSWVEPKIFKGTSVN